MDKVERERGGLGDERWKWMKQRCTDNNRRY